MTLHNLPKMLYSYTEGWPELIRIHPSVMRLFTLYVMPMSLIPPVMFMYSSMVTPGAVFPELVPQMTMGEAIAVMITLYLTQLVMVPFMASMIQQMGEVVDITPRYEDTFMLAAIAPTPLWLAPLALLAPFLWVNVAVVALAWVASAALIYHGVPPLFKLEDPSKAHLMGTFVLTTGVIAWAALLVILTLALSMIVGLR